VEWAWPAVADTAARLDIPVVRLFPDSQHSKEELFKVHRERPAVLIFASQKDAQTFHYIPEAERLVMLPEDVHDSFGKAYAQTESVLDGILAARPNQVLLSNLACRNCCAFADGYLCE
jgi:hypothetical protein